MCKKLFYLGSFVLILGWLTTSAMADLEEGLVAYWPLDEGAGESTVDVSGNGSTGTLNGGPAWAEGKLGGALNFDGNDDYVDCGNPAILDFGTGDWTISAWFNVTDVGDDDPIIYSKGGDSGGGIRYEIFMREGNSQDLRFLIDDNDSKRDPDTDDFENLNDGIWHHVVAMRRDGTDLRVYVDGVEDMGVTNHGEATIAADDDLSGITQHNAHIGANYHHGNNEVQKFFRGLIDDVALWNRAITEEEIAYLYNSGDGNPVAASAAGLASNLIPADGANEVSRDMALTWTPYELAVTHNLYFGTAFEDVNDATAPTASNLDVNSFDPGRLEFGTTYFWRVDEVNGAPDNTVFKGRVVSFEVEPIAVPVAPVTVTASSNGEDTGPENTINGSGLMPDTGTHSTELADMWVSGDDQDPNEPVSILYEFDRTYKLNDVRIWNSNQRAEDFLGFGFKDVIITTSTDGENWTRLGGEEGLIQFDQASGDSQYTGQSIGLGSVAASYVKLTGVNNWSAIFNRYSLSEVQFSAIPTEARTPVPESGSSDILPGDILSWRAGREAAQSTVYVTTDPNELVAGTAPSATSNTHSVSLSEFDIAMGQTYYWRVDEVNNAEAVSVWAGPVWSFSTVATVVVDDFESYNNDSPNRPFQVWLDGYGYSADEFFPAGYNGNGTGAGVGHDIWSVAS